jgi:hypothetical protein
MVFARHDHCHTSSSHHDNLKGRTVINDMAAVFGLALIEMWAAIPLGLHLKLHPGLLIVATIAGASIGVIAATFLGETIRKLIFWRKKEQVGSGKLATWLSTKGPWAVGLLGPLLIGPIFAAGLAATLGMPRRLSIALLAAGIVLWTVSFTLLGHFGLSTFR